MARSKGYPVQRLESWSNLLPFCSTSLVGAFSFAVKIMGHSVGNEISCPGFWLHSLGMFPDSGVGIWKRRLLRVAGALNMRRFYFWGQSIVEICNGNVLHQALHLKTIAVSSLRNQAWRPCEEVKLGKPEQAWQGFAIAIGMFWLPFRCRRDGSTGDHGPKLPRRFAPKSLQYSMCCKGVLHLSISKFYCNWYTQVYVW